MDKKVIILTIEITSRELESKCLLALYLIQRGFRVYICTVNPLFILKNKLNSSIFFHKSTYNKRAKEYKNTLGATFVFMDEENGIAVPRSFLKQSCNARFLNMPTNTYDHVFTIGNSYKVNQEDMPQFKGVKLDDTGWPRIDLWREEFKELYTSDINEIKQIYGSYYLMISSFNVMSEDILNQRKKEYAGNQFQIDIETSRYEAFKDFVELIKLLSINIDKNEKIILRPHPSESLKEWKKILGNIINVQIVKEKSATPWILGANAVIQYGSTVGLQAALNNIPSIQYKVEQKVGITDTPIFELSEHTDTIEGVLAFIKKYKGKKDDTLRKKVIELIKDDVSSLDGKLATEKIVDILDSIELVKQPKIVLNFFEKFKVKLKYKLLQLYDLYQSLKRFGKPTFIMPMKEKRSNGLELNEIKNIIDKLATIQNVNIQNIEYKNIAHELISIEIKDEHEK